MGFLKVNTAVTTEPITLAEVKRHLRIYDDGYNDTQSETITTRAVGASVVTGTSVDIQGCEATVWVNVGVVAAGGKLDVVIHESDDNNTFTAWSGGTFTQISAAGSVSKSYTGGKRYIKAIATITVNTITFGANVQMLAGDPVVDAELSSMITRAREEAEEMTRLAFAPQTLEYALDSFPSGNYIELPRPPLASVTTVKTYDSDGTPTTLTAATQYLVDADSTPGRIALPYAGTGPSGADYPINPIRIVYVAGYTTLPQRLKNILLYHVGLLYKYRDTAILEGDRKTLEGMYNFYRVSWFGGELVR
jgi:uncharacterized phiE125 gp8 family phage protein